MSNKRCSWHGDIKPDNILWVHGEFKLADFGFAKFESNTQRSTQMTGGTHSYGTIPDLGSVILPSNPDLIRGTRVRPSESSNFDTASPKHRHLVIVLCSLVSGHLGYSRVSSV